MKTNAGSSDLRTSFQWRPRRRSLLALTLCGLLAGPLLADDGDEKDEVAPDADIEVVVTTTMEGAAPEDSSATVTVVTREEIERLETQSVADALRAVAGLDVVQSGSPGHTTSLFMRGTDSNQMLLLLDGVPLSDPYFGGYEWATLSTEDVERIEVVRGPFSALYGSDAIGGVVNIITRRGEGGPRLDALVEGGSEGYAHAQASVGGKQSGLDYLVSGAWRDGDGTFENDDFEETTGDASVGYGNDDMRIGLRARVTDASAGIPFEGSTPTPWRAYDSEERVVAVPFDHEVTDAFSYHVELSRVDATYDYDDLGALFPYASTTDTTADRLSATGSLTLGVQRLSFGGELEKLEVDNVDNFGVQIDGKSNDSWGAFVQDSIAWESLALTLGVRYDDHESFGGQVSPRASVAWSFGGEESGGRLKAGYGLGFRAPTAGELYFPYSGNLLLEAEESRSFEVGIAGHAMEGRIRGELTWFDTQVDNLIDFEFSTNTFQNIGEASMKGLELSFFGDLSGGFSILATYTKLDATDEVDDVPLKRRPDNRACLTLNYDWDGKLNANLRAIWVDDRPDIDPDTFVDITNDGYTRLDLACSYQALDWLRPFVRVENVADEDYSEAAGFPAPGRTFIGGLRFSVGE